MNPIDYTMDVLNPIEGALRGYSLGREDIQNRQIMQERSQNMGIQRQKFADQQQALQEQRAAAAQQREQAMERQARLSRLQEMAANGTLTAADISQSALQDAKTFEEFGNAFKQLSEPVQKAQTQFAIGLSTALVSENPQIGINLLDERIQALKNTGTPEANEEANRLEIVKKQAVLDPKVAGLSTIYSLRAQGVIDDKSLEFFVNSSNKQKDAVSPLGKIAQDVSSGIIPKSVLDSAIAVDKAAADGGLTLPQKISEEARLRGEYSKRIEDLSAAERNFSIIETSAADNSGAGDIALVTSFMKMLDPGSVVRETEFATAANTGGLLAKLKSAVTKIEDGKFLSPEQRTDFQRLAGKYLEAANTQEQGVQSSYQKIIDNYGLNPVNVFGARAATAAAPSGTPVAAEVQPAPADAASGSIPLSFMSDEGVKKAADAAGVTPEEMWAVMPDDVRAKYVR